MPKFPVEESVVHGEEESVLGLEVELETKDLLEATVEESVELGQEEEVFGLDDCFEIEEWMEISNEDPKGSST